MKRMILLFGVVCFLATDMQALAGIENKPIELPASKKVLSVIEKWDSKIWFVMSAKDPLRTLNELKKDEIACWGGELVKHVLGFREALGIPTDDNNLGVHVIGIGRGKKMQELIPYGLDKPARLFITWSRFAPNLEGAIRVVFVGEHTQYGRIVPDRKKTLELKESDDKQRSHSKLFLASNRSKPITNPVVRIELSISKRQTSQNGRVSQVRKGHSTGSGFIVSTNGYIITNNHVIHPTDGHGEFDVDSLRVCLNPYKPFVPHKTSGIIKKAKVIAFDKDADIAVIKIDYPKPLPLLTFGSSADMRVDNCIGICGYPLGGRFRQTKGKITQTLQRSTERPTGILVCNAKAVPGNSGGPALDAGGRIIGVTVAMVNLERARFVGEVADYGTQAFDRMRAMTIKTAKETGMPDSLCQEVLEELEKGVQDINELKKQLYPSWVWKEAQKHPHLTYTIASDDVKRLLDKWNINIKEVK